MKEHKYRVWVVDIHGKGKMGYFKLIDIRYDAIYCDYKDAYEKVPWNFAMRRPLMQYTGLEDKHGEEIYEGDIIGPITVLDGNKSVYDSNKLKKKYEVVVFERGAFTFGEGFILGAIAEQLEIISNIYENKGLLND